LKLLSDDQNNQKSISLENLHMDGLFWDASSEEPTKEY
jgi:hypothetical protein